MHRPFTRVSLFLRDAYPNYVFEKLLEFFKKLKTWGLLLRREESKNNEKGIAHMSQYDSFHQDRSGSGTSRGRHKPVPLVMAQGPHEYIPGEQEGPVQLSSM